MQKEYSINVYKEYFNFSASHFVVFHDGTREPLHGHNYRLRLKIHTKSLNEGDMVFDFLDIKPIVKEICDQIDHSLLLSEKNPYLKIEIKDQECHINTLENHQFVVPTSDVKILPIENTTAEKLAVYLADQIQEKLFSRFHQLFPKMEIEVEETPGQSAIYHLEN